MRKHTPTIIGLIILMAVSTLGTAPHAVVAAGLPALLPQELNATDLQAAINAVANNGIIELPAGTYTAPAGGFHITDAGKSFTIRAAAPGSVVLDGGGVNPIFRYYNNSSYNYSVVFEGLTFRNGYTATDGYAGGISIERASATFVNCVFENNRGRQGTAGGGAMFITQSSKVLILDSSFNGNNAINYGGAIALEFGSLGYIHNSIFTGNRTNLPGHFQFAAGGAIHVGNSTLRVSNSTFTANEAGYVGGGIYAIGQWNQAGSDVIVANSLFSANRAQNDPSVNPGVPTEGGAFHAEDKTTARIYFSRFINNSAMTGGGVNLYRAVVEVNDSTFLGNQATGPTNGNGFGGAMSAISKDTGLDGGSNPRPANLTVRRTFVLGRYGSTGSAARVAAGIYVNGDSCRAFGGCGIATMDGTVANRATLTLDTVVLADLSANAPENVAGGAVLADLANVSANNSLFLKNEVLGTQFGSGGALSAMYDSSVTITNSSLVNNTAVFNGGALVFTGSTMNVASNHFINNSLTSTVLGAGGTAINTRPCTTSATCSINFNQSGVAQTNTFVGQTGVIIGEDFDSNSQPYITTQYNQNVFYLPSTSTQFYKNPSFNTFYNVDGLNNAVYHSVDKGNGNTASTGTPTLGRILAVPSAILPSGARGETGPLPAYLSTAWSGSSATLDGASQGSRYGWIATTAAGGHTLSVGSSNFSVSIPTAATPAAEFKTGSGGTSLEWSNKSGSYLDGMIDREINLGIYPAASGGVSFTGSPRVYRYYAIHQEGGVVVTLDLNTPKLAVSPSLSALIGLNLPNRDLGVPISNVGGQTMNWSVTNNSPSLFQVLTPSGSTTTTGTVQLRVLANTPGTYNGQIVIDAGTGGVQTVSITVLVVTTARQLFLPAIKR